MQKMDTLKVVVHYRIVRRYFVGIIKEIVNFYDSDKLT